MCCSTKLFDFFFSLRLTCLLQRLGVLIMFVVRCPMTLINSFCLRFFYYVPKLHYYKLFLCLAAVFLLPVRRKKNQLFMYLFIFEEESTKSKQLCWSNKVMLSTGPVDIGPILTCGLLSISWKYLQCTLCISLLHAATPWIPHSIFSWTASTTVLWLISIVKKDRCKDLQDAWHDLQAIEWMQGGRCKMLLYISHFMVLLSCKSGK